MQFLSESQVVSCTAPVLTQAEIAMASLGSPLVIWRGIAPDSCSNSMQFFAVRFEPIRSVWAQIAKVSVSGIGAFA